MTPPDDKATATAPTPATDRRPAWKIAYLFPDQGQWSEGDYLALDTNHLVEFSDGHVEVLPAPTTSHQEIVLFLCMAIKAYLADHKLGRVVMAPFKVRLRADKFREPDVVFLLREHAERIGELFWDGADLVMEVVSEDRRHDLVVKRAEYAQAGIPEYWIVDPRERRITVLTLRDGEYAVHGEFAPGETATSPLLPGLAIDAVASLIPPA